MKHSVKDNGSAMPREGCGHGKTSYEAFLTAAAPIIKPVASGTPRVPCVLVFHTICFLRQLPETTGLIISEASSKPRWKISATAVTLRSIVSLSQTMAIDLM
jgi:hypothetical protein